MTTRSTFSCARAVCGSVTSTAGNSDKTISFWRDATTASRSPGVASISGTCTVFPAKPYPIKATRISLGRASLSLKFGFAARLVEVLDQHQSARGGATHIGQASVLRFSERIQLVGGRVREFGGLPTGCRQRLPAPPVFTISSKAFPSGLQAIGVSSLGDDSKILNPPEPFSCSVAR